jgi:hypothetical protein
MMPAPRSCGSNLVGAEAEEDHGVPSGIEAADEQNGHEGGARDARLPRLAREHVVKLGVRRQRLLSECLDHLQVRDTLFGLRSARILTSFLTSSKCSPEDIVRRPSAARTTASPRFAARHIVTHRLYRTFPSRSRTERPRASCCQPPQDVPRRAVGHVNGGALRRAGRAVRRAGAAEVAAAGMTLSRMASALHRHLLRAVGVISTCADRGETVPAVTEVHPKGVRAASCSLLPATSPRWHSQCGPQRAERTGSMP